MTEDAKERKRRRDRARYHRQKLLPGWNEKRIARNERSRQYAIANRERLEEYRRAWRKLNPEKLAAQRKRYRERVKSDPARLVREQVVRSEYLDNGGGRELRAQYFFLRWRRRRRIYETDPVAYAEYRRKLRERYAKKVGASYRPRLAMRIPDWATMGQDILDRRSVFLSESYTKNAQMSNENFAMHLAIGRTI